MTDMSIPGLDVEELLGDEHDAGESEIEAETVQAGWPAQRRRKGSSAELPAPQGYLDLPTWMTTPAKRPLADDSV